MAKPPTKMSPLCLGTSAILIDKPSSSSLGKSHAFTTSSHDISSPMGGIVAVFDPREIIENQESEPQKDDITSTMAATSNVSLDELTESSSSLIKTSREALHLMVSDGILTFSGRIEVKDVKLPKKDQSNVTSSDINMDKMEDISRFILEPIEKIIVTYRYTKQDNSPGDDDTKVVDTEPNSIQIKIKHQMDNVMRILWSGELQVMPQLEQFVNFQSRQQKTPSEPVNAMPLLQALASSLEESNKKIDELKKSQRRLESQLYGWKDTAQKLDNTWQYEKDEMLERFLIILNKSKETAEKVHGELVEVKKEREEYKQAAAAASVSTTGNRGSMNFLSSTELMDDVDQHDAQPFVKDEVLDELINAPTNKRRREYAAQGRNAAKKRALIRSTATAPSQSQQSLSMSQPTTNSLHPSQCSQSQSQHSKHQADVLPSSNLVKVEPEETQPMKKPISDAERQAKRAKLEKRRLFAERKRQEARERAAKKKEAEDIADVSQSQIQSQSQFDLYSQQSLDTNTSQRLIQDTKKIPPKHLTSPSQETIHFESLNESTECDNGMTRQVTHSQSIEKVKFSSVSENFTPKDVDIQRGEKLSSITHMNPGVNSEMRDDSSTDSNMSDAII